MMAYKKHPRKPLFTDKKSSNIFVALFFEEHHKRVAEALFVDGLTNEETAEKIGYSTRQIERLRVELLRMAVKKLIEKQIPKKPNIHGYREGREINTISYTCPICNKHIGRENFCKHCGQALRLE